MTQRPLHAALLTPGDRLRELLGAALDGSGPAVAPVDPGLPPARLRGVLRMLAPTAVITPDGVTRRRGGRPVAGGTALVIVTSGSTGGLKAAELSAAAVHASARASLERIGARPGERWLCCLPASHIAGTQVLVRSLLAGVRPLICAPSDTAAIASAAREGCVHAALVPTQLRRVLELGGQGSSGLAGLRTVLLGGAAPPAGLVDTASAAGARVVTTYGMTETCGGCVYDGLPLDGVAVQADAGARIRLAGPVLLSGYRLRPDLTAAVMDGSWFVTSDLGRMDPDGCLRVLGRADDVITTGGEKVIPGEVAAAIETHPAVREAIVFGVADAEWGERVTSVIVLTEGASPPTLAEMRAHVAERIGASAAPREVVITSQIPLLPSGKADVTTLRARIREQSGGLSVSK
jgi:O-succinylbenzoic acid--CoA ligase